MLSNHSYANGVEKWLDLSLQVATNLWLPVYNTRGGFAAAWANWQF